MWAMRCDSAEKNRSRIFVGNIDASTDPEALQLFFSKYGEIVSAVVLKGYGFVQFVHESAATAAMEQANGTIFNGLKIDVKPAKRSGEVSSESSLKKEDFSFNKNMVGNQRFSGFSLDRRGPHEDMLRRDGIISGFPSTPSGTEGQIEKANDCEIVCINRKQRDYAEVLENRLKMCSIEVDILFPNPDIPLNKILGNIAGRGVLYAIVLSPLNEEHRTVTLNILQGQQQEHRNMPLDDAIHMIIKNYDGTKTIIDNKSNTSGSQSSSLPPDIVNVIGFLAENRPLSVMEYDKLIRYLAGKRENVLREEYGDSIPAHLVTPPIGPVLDPSLRAKQEEIQAKVLAILNRPLSQLVIPSVGREESTPAINVATALNPTLQKAIDTLIKTGPNLLNSAHNSNLSGSQYYANSRNNTTSNLYNPYSDQYGAGKY